MGAEGATGTLAGEVGEAVGAERGPPVAIVRTSSGAPQPQGAAMGLQPAGGSGHDGGGSSLGRAGRSAVCWSCPLVLGERRKPGKSRLAHLDLPYVLDGQG